MRPTLYSMAAAGFGLVFTGLVAGKPDDSERRGKLYGLCVMLGLAAAAIAMFALVATAAFAQGAAPAPAMTVDFRPFFDQVLMPALTTLMGLLVPVLATWATVKLANLLHVKANAALSDQVLGAVTNAAKFAVNEAQATGDKNLVGVTHNEMVAKAAQYLNTNVKGKMDALGLTDEHIDNLIRSALPPPEIVAAAQRQSTAAPPPTSATKAE